MKTLSRIIRQWIEHIVYQSITPEQQQAVEVHFRIPTWKLLVVRKAHKGYRAYWLEREDEDEYLLTGQLNMVLPSELYKSLFDLLLKECGVFVRFAKTDVQTKHYQLIRS